MTAGAADAGLETLDLLTIEMVASRLNLSVPTIWRLVGSGALGSVKIGASRRVAPEQIIEFKARLMAEAKGAA